MIFRKRDSKKKIEKLCNEAVIERVEKNDLVETSEITLVVKLNEMVDDETMAKLKEIFGNDIDEVEMRPIRKEN